MAAPGAPPTSALVRRQTPEERELDKKKAELAALSIKLIQAELDLATLEGELGAFERRYVRIVGVRYAELDGIEVQIAEALARQNPRDTASQAKASQARAQAEESAKASDAAKEPGPPEKFVASAALRQLYREVAKRIHPDLASDDADRARRTQMMAEANRAYELGDEARLRAILDTWEQSPEAVKGDGPGSELVRLIRQIAQIEDRLCAVEAGIEQLKKCDLYQLKQKVEEAEAKGHHLLDEMVKRLDGQIADARRRLAETLKGDAA
jgi:hypothetical protein